MNRNIKDAMKFDDMRKSACGCGAAVFKATLNLSLAQLELEKSRDQHKVLDWLKGASFQLDRVENNCGVLLQDVRDDVELAKTKPLDSFTLIDLSRYKLYMNLIRCEDAPISVFDVPGGSDE